MANPKFKLEGKRFGKLLVMTQIEQNGNDNWKGFKAWLCKCDCGQEIVKTTGMLKSGRIKSCGCGVTSHKYKGHKLVKIYHGIKSRCYNLNHKSFHNYGGRDIGMCKEWRENQLAFIEWSLKNGWEKQLEFDRINNDEDYSPNNCRFVNKTQNALNKRLSKLNTSGYTGIQITKNGKYTSRITIYGLVYYLGTFIKLQDAIAAREEILIEAYH